jgi:hypothetical protein
MILTREIIPFLAAITGNRLRTWSVSKMRPWTVAGMF